MPKIAYIDHRFSQESLDVVEQANRILEEYSGEGYILTLRQLYYQFVARGLLENTNKSYKRLGALVNNARLAGLVDWVHLEDRTRSLESLEHFEGPGDALNKLAGWYHIDMWERQRFRPEVWIEKDALVGVIEGVCQELDVPFFSCRGYTSQSEMWQAARRLGQWERFGQTPYVIHLGDHDPSGIDMSRDIVERLGMFWAEVEFKRIALNMDQVEAYRPPPNPAKLSDSRCSAYVRRFGDKSWELDALNPSVLSGLVRETVEALRDDEIYEQDLEDRLAAKQRLVGLAHDWLSD